MWFSDWFNLRCVCEFLHVYLCDLICICTTDFYGKRNNYSRANVVEYVMSFSHCHIVGKGVGVLISFPAIKQSLHLSNSLRIVQLLIP